MKDQCILGIILICSGIFSAGFFFLGYYVTDLIDINTAIKNIRDEMKEEVISSLKDAFSDDEGEEWDDIDEIFDNKDYDEDEMCFGLKIRFDFLPEEVKNLNSIIFLFFREIKFNKINENNKNIKLINFIDGIIVSGITILIGILIFFFGICKTFDACLTVFFYFLVIILTIEIFAIEITKIVFTIKQWVYYHGSNIKFSVKFIKSCNLKEIFKKYYKFLFNIKSYIVGAIFTELFNIFIAIDMLAIKFAFAVLTKA